MPREEPIQAHRETLIFESETPGLPLLLLCPFILEKYLVRTLPKFLDDSK
jgi:hypothetical protein